MTKKKITLPITADVPVELSKALPLPPDTTAQQDVESAGEREAKIETRKGQRKINLIWEGTQGIISVFLVFTLCYAILREIQVVTEFWILVSIVVQSYFQRTNHTRIGGVGPKYEEYTGR